MKSHKVFRQFIDELFTTIEPTLGSEPFKNIAGKGEKADNQHAFPFPTMFSIPSKKNYYVCASLKSSFKNPFKLDNAKILPCCDTFSNCSVMESGACICKLFCTRLIAKSHSIKRGYLGL